MKSLIVFLAIIGFALSTCVDPRTRFYNFKKSFVRKYHSSSEEEEKYEVFRKNLEEIEQHNARYEAGLETYYKGVDQFADMTNEEFEAFLPFEQQPAEMDDNITDYEAPARLRLPNSVDYRNKGACNPPRDQKKCGSCWAFATVGCLESHIFLRTGKLPLLSPQYLMDCDTKKSGGCNWGYAELAFQYIAANGIATEDDYPYVGRNEECKKENVEKIPGLTNFRWIKPRSEKGLKYAVATVGPIAVYVDAKEWKGFKGDIFQAKEPFKKLTHVVVIDGYGVEKGIAYWLIRNSWGRSWGEKGYIRIRRGINQIGITRKCCFPLFKK